MSAWKSAGVEVQTLHLNVITAAADPLDRLLPHPPPLPLPRRRRRNANAVRQEVFMTLPKTIARAVQREPLRIIAM